MAIYASAWVAITAVGNDIKFYIVMHVWSLCNRPLEIWWWWWWCTYMWSTVETWQRATEADELQLFSLLHSAHVGLAEMQLADVRWPHCLVVQRTVNCHVKFDCLIDHCLRLTQLTHVVLYISRICLALRGMADCSQIYMVNAATSNANVIVQSLLHCCIKSNQIKWFNRYSCTDAGLQQYRGNAFTTNNITSSASWQHNSSDKNN